MSTDLAAIRDAGFTAYPSDHQANPHLEPLAAAFREGSNALPALARVEAWWDGLEDAMRKAEPEKFKARGRPLRF